jgi:hypothetical protein
MNNVGNEVNVGNVGAATGKPAIFNQLPRIIHIPHIKPHSPH